MNNRIINIAIPPHADMEGTRTCHICGSTMYPSSTERDITTHERIKLHITGIKNYTCSACGEIIYTSDEMQRIEDAVATYLPTKHKP